MLLLDAFPSFVSLSWRCFGEGRIAVIAIDTCKNRCRRCKSKKKPQQRFHDVSQTRSLQKLNLVLSLLQVRWRRLLVGKRKLPTAARWSSYPSRESKMPSNGVTRCSFYSAEVVANLFWQQTTRPWYTALNVDAWRRPIWASKWVPKAFKIRGWGLLLL